MELVQRIRSNNTLFEKYVYNTVLQVVPAHHLEMFNFPFCNQSEYIVCSYAAKQVVYFVYCHL